MTRRIMRKPAALLILLALGISIWTSCVEVGSGNQAPQILEAISIGDVDALRTILKNTPSAVKTRDQDKKTFLHLCGAHPVLSLLKHGADINAKDKYGRTPLHWALSSNSEEMVELLVDHGAGVNAKNLQGKTPLYYAWGRSGVDREIAEILKGHGGTGGF